MRHLEDAAPGEGPRKRNHGHSHSSEYQSWLNAKQRCHNKNHPRYKDWGAKGITVCEQWRENFMAFYCYMGEKPKKDMSLDRIDGSKGYEPGNCRWATKQMQSENRPTWVKNLTAFGETRTMSNWARKIGIRRESLRDRIEAGWPLETALSKPKSESRK